MPNSLNVPWCQHKLAGLCPACSTLGDGTQPPRNVYGDVHGLWHTVHVVFPSLFLLLHGGLLQNISQVKFYNGLLPTAS
jgi:hypothetical protein